jgi:uncharacterized membrane protein YfcA
VKRLLAWSLLIGSVIGWPLSALTVAKDEPQFILGLSWLAVILTALDGLWVAKVEEKDDDAGSRSTSIT